MFSPSKIDPFQRALQKNYDLRSPMAKKAVEEDKTPVIGNKKKAKKTVRPKSRCSRSRLYLNRNRAAVNPYNYLAHSVADEEIVSKGTKTDETMLGDDFASTIDVLALNSPPRPIAMDILEVDTKIREENANNDVDLFKGTWMDPAFFPYVPENEVCSPSLKVLDSNKAGAWFYWT